MIKNRKLLEKFEKKLLEKGEKNESS